MRSKDEEMKRVTTEPKQRFVSDESFEDSTHPIDSLLKRAASPKCDGAVIGTLADFSASGQPLVSVPSGFLKSLTEARTCVRLGPEHLRRSFVLLFEANPSIKPTTVGLLECVGG